MKILVTGVAGFIGFHVAHKLLQQDHKVVGIDNLNDYYDPTLKDSRLLNLQKHDKHNNFDFIKLDISDNVAVAELFKQGKFDCVIHLAAQAGVRYSLNNPHLYVQSNIVGFLNILEGCRHSSVAHLVYASSSSVYGLNGQMPFSENSSVNHPISFYGATKRANEIMAHSYSTLYGLPTTGLRFFTVYGPWGRPDMALFKFTKSIMIDEPIDVYNFGKHKRDFTYIDDIVQGILAVAQQPAKANPNFDVLNPDPASSNMPWRVFNIGNSKPVELQTYIELIENYLGKKAKVNLLPLQAGDVPDTHAEVTNLENAVNYKPTTTVRDGVKKFLDWYTSYYAEVVH